MRNEEVGVTTSCEDLKNRLSKRYALSLPVVRTATPGGRPSSGQAGLEGRREHDIQLLKLNILGAWLWHT